MLFVASNASDWWMTTFTPYSSDQMIGHLNMKIGEADSGSARLLCAASNLAEPESTSPIFMLKFLIIWSLLKGVKVIIHQSLVLFPKDSIPITNTADLLLLDLLLVELIAV